MNTEQKQQALDELKQEILDKNICAGLASQATQLVMGEGSVDADIVLVGEAPGKNEDLQGRPFIGAAGKFLDQMLAGASMVRQDVYITNIVKYRPPNNRDPSPEEKAEFWPYLLRQLEIIQPKAIVTLGRHSGAYFVPDLKISNDHGHAKTTIYHGSTWTVIPLYHPAAALYNGSMRRVLMNDFAKMSVMLKTL